MNDAAQAATPAWRQRVDSSGVCYLTLDRQDSSGNALSQAVLEEFDAALDKIAAASELKGLVILSGKPVGFIAGADIKEFDSIDSATRGTELAARGQAIFAKLEALRIPTVAAINGYALGGGLELALACTYRVAVESYDRSLGLPEVQLGIHPGFGGTVRLVNLLGAPLALDLMLTGRQLSPVEAMSVGLVDHIVPREKLLEASKLVIRDRPPPQRAAIWQRALNWTPLRKRVAARVRATVSRRARADHYPAPFAIVGLWEKYGAIGEAAYRAEAESIGRLFMTATSRNLVRVFRLREHLKSLGPKRTAIERVHVIGAGVMGGDIAAWCAMRGLEVSLQDQVPAAIDGAIERADTLFKRRLHAPGSAEAARKRLRSDSSGDLAADAEIAIEAVVERLGVKREVFAALEEKVSAEAMLASNTSSLRIEEIASNMRHAQRFFGLHFFNPVAKMPLVEVIRGPQTDVAVLERAMAFVTQIGKLPLPCASSPGFVVNRILTPYLFEALRAHQDGRSLEEIDAAAVAFGMPVGPIELCDQVGLDVAMHVAEIMQGTTGEPPPALLARMVEENKLGKKTKLGFYAYENGKAVKQPLDASSEDQRLQDRLILPLLNESVACVAEGVVDDHELLDAGAVFGAGFAPFRGGPIRYARERGVKDVVATLESLATEHGRRFAPHPGWQPMLRET